MIQFECPRHPIPPIIFTFVVGIFPFSHYYIHRAHQFPGIPDPCFAPRLPVYLHTGERLLRLIFRKNTPYRCKDGDDVITMTEMSCLTGIFSLDSSDMKNFKKEFDKMVREKVGYLSGLVEEYLFNFFSPHIHTTCEIPFNAAALYYTVIHSLSTMLIDSS